MRVLGIDPGLVHTGWSIIDTKDNSFIYIASGVILPKINLSLSERISFIFNEVSKICDLYNPDEASIEITFVNQNPKTTLALGHARAASIIAISNKNIKVYEYEPNKIKKALTGAGHADKEQIHKMLKILLPCACPKTSDEADAIAMALVHINLSKKIL